MTYVRFSVQMNSFPHMHRFYILLLLFITRESDLAVRCVVTHGVIYIKCLFQFVLPLADKFPSLFPKGLFKKAGILLNTSQGSLVLSTNMKHTMNGNLECPHSNMDFKSLVAKLICECQTEPMH